MFFISHRQEATKMKLGSLITLMIMGVVPTEAFFDQFFQQQQQQGQHRRGGGDVAYDERFYRKECQGYICPDTLSCVKRPVDCPCPFPDSQIKCTIPGSKKGSDTYVCISKGERDCKFVNNAYKGLV